MNAIDTLQFIHKIKCSQPAKMFMCEIQYELFLMVLFLFILYLNYTLKNPVRSIYVGSLVISYIFKKFG